MASRKVDYLLVGGGLASANCARWLRESGADGSVLLVGREPDRPYNRPPLSKGYLRGEASLEDDVLFRPDAWWEEQQIEVMTRTSVTRFDAGDRAAALSNGDEVEFGKALLATGANVNVLHHLPGSELEGIHYLRARRNSDAIREDAESAERVVLIGGSYIGTEVAASLTALGKRCTIVMMEEVTFERQFGAEVGGFFQGVLEEHGVEVHGSDSLDRFEGADGRVTKVVTKAGRELPCECVVIGAGVHPEVALAKSAGLDVGEAGGVVCSSRLETSAPGVFAAGDIAEYDSPLHGRRMRIEHWDVAFNQGKTAALNLLGKDQPHDVLPYFFSDLADWSSMEYVGPGSGELAVRGSLDDGEFCAFYLDEGKVVAALNVGRSDDFEHAQRLVKQRAAASPDQLRDESTDLAELGD